jgi:hypothetical protein
MFPNCPITVFDNYSTDQTKSIFEKLGCSVIQYDTNNKLSDSKYLEIKNNCWKYSPNDWILICDIDEILFLNEQQLEYEESLGVTAIRGEGYNMYNTSSDPDNIDIEGLQYGLRASQYDKIYVFNKKFITDINYFAGCHNANPQGYVKYSENKYKLLHYKALGENYVVDRYRMFGERMSDENKRNRWGAHYLEEENNIRRDYKNGVNSPELIKLI